MNNTQEQAKWLSEITAQMAEGGELQRKHHVHHDCIVAWAKGAEIEVENGWGQWISMDKQSTHWAACNKYRIRSTNHNADKITELEQQARELADKIAELKESNP